MAKEPTKKATSKKTAVRKVAIKKAVKTTSVKKGISMESSAKSIGVTKKARALPAVSSPVAVAPRMGAVTTVIAKFDAGFGNTLFLRGDGPGLSWSKGAAMDNMAADEWIFVAKDVSSPFECKILINDEVWSSGENMTVAPGTKSIHLPQF